MDQRGAMLDRKRRSHRRHFAVNPERVVAQFLRDLVQIGLYLLWVRLRARASRGCVNACNHRLLQRRRRRQASQRQRARERHKHPRSGSAFGRFRAKESHNHIEFALRGRRAAIAAQAQLIQRYAEQEDKPIDARSFWPFGARFCKRRTRQFRRQAFVRHTARKHIQFRRRAAGCTQALADRRREFCKLPTDARQRRLRFVPTALWPRAANASMDIFVQLRGRTNAAASGPCP